MTILEVTQYISIAIPIVAFAALFVSVFLFVKSKGTVDALKEAANTYRTLADAYRDTIDQLEEKITALEVEIEELKRIIEVQKEAMKIAVDEFVKATKGINGGH